MLYALFEEWVACVIGFNYLGGPVLSADYRPSGNLRAIVRSDHPGNPVQQSAILGARRIYFTLIDGQGNISDGLQGINEAIGALREANAARLAVLGGETQRLIAQARERVKGVRSS